MARSGKVGHSFITRDVRSSESELKPSFDHQPGDLQLKWQFLEIDEENLYPGNPTVWGGNLFQRFCYVFSECLGSMADAGAVQLNGLWNSQKTLYKTFGTIC